VAGGISVTAASLPIPVVARENSACAPKNFFIIFVDAIFTTLFERLFTKLFDVNGANPRGCCVYRACNAD
jgi:hypothetical protein